MITATGYSKDPMIQPEGIVITFGEKLLQDQGGAGYFERAFKLLMASGGTWMHKMTKFPTQEVDHIYIIIENHLWGRVYSGGFHRGQSGREGFTMDGRPKSLDFPHVVLAGPFEPCPFERELRGFQGFRYCTKLF